jgi:glycosyltransferase involved in cell wall biosynthesis
LARIGIDARTLSGRYTGDRTYWRNLIKALSRVDPVNEYVLYLRRSIPESDALALGANFTTRVLTAASERIWSLLTFPQALRRDGIDLAHVQYTVPPLMPCPVVTTIHDVTFKLFPELFAAKDRLLLNFAMPGSLRRASHVLTVSENSRRDILRCYPFVAPENVTATLLAAEERFRPMAEEKQDSARQLVKDRYGLSDPYLLAVGVLQPRKNLPMLARAFLSARRGGNLPHRLVVAGKRGWLSAETETALAAGGDAIVFTDYVPDADLPALYACADALAYPSLYEGFGLPPLEAMACGCPVIVSSTSSLPEVVGDAGLLLPPSDEPAWTNTIINILSDVGLRDDLRARGLRQAARFSWAETARKTRAVYEEAT